MKRIITPQDVRGLGTILSIWAHPDDETFCAGALMAAAVRNGQQVICVTATRGEQGVQDAERWPEDQLADTREHELMAALKELGITEHHWFDYRDGECNKASLEEAARRITSLIERRGVDSVLTFGPEGLTGHPDHCSVSHWVDAAVHASSRKPRVYHAVQLKEPYEQYMKKLDEKLNIYFNINQPPLMDEMECEICFKADASCAEQKYRAFAAMPSQQASLLKLLPHEAFRGAFGIEAFVLGSTPE